MMLIDLVEDFYTHGGYDDCELFGTFCVNYRADDYRHSVPIDAPQGAGFEHEDD